MRMLSKLLAGYRGRARVGRAAAGPAHGGSAGHGGDPQGADIVGVGSDTIGVPVRPALA